MRLFPTALIGVLVACGGKTSEDGTGSTAYRQHAADDNDVQAPTTNASASSSSSGDTSVPCPNGGSGSGAKGVCHGAENGWECSSLLGSPEVTCDEAGSGSKCTCAGTTFTLPYAADGADKIGEVWSKYCSCLPH